MIKSDSKDAYNIVKDFKNSLIFIFYLINVILV